MAGYTPTLDTQRAEMADLVRFVIVAISATSVVIIVLSIALSFYVWWILLVASLGVVIGLIFLEPHITRSEWAEVVDVGGIHARILRPGSHLLIRGLESIPSRNRADLRVQFVPTFKNTSVVIELSTPGDRALVTGGQAGYKVGDRDADIIMYLFGVTGGKKSVAEASIKIYEDGVQSYLAGLSLNQIRPLFGDSESDNIEAKVGASLKRYGMQHVSYTFGSADEAPGTRQRRDIIASREDFFKAMLQKAKELAFVTLTNEDLPKPGNEAALQRVQAEISQARDILLQTSFFAALSEGDFTGFTDINAILRNIGVGTGQQQQGQQGQQQQGQQGQQRRGRRRN